MDIAKYALRAIPLDELPAWSPWPARLLGLADWKIPNRTPEKAEREYDKDEYLRCLHFARERRDVTPEEVKAFELRLEQLKNICVSSKGSLYELPAHQMMPIENDLLRETMEPLIQEADIIVEIGCGYGFNLWELHKHFPEKTYYGGEYSPNAVTLAGLLYTNHLRIAVQRCNFYDQTYNVLEQCPPNARVVLLTRHAIEQLPTAAHVMGTLTQYFDRLVAVVHMEVVYENYDSTLLGLMRKRYTIINDYNRDLLGLVQKRGDIELLKNSPDEHGLNPFNPTSVLVWKPRKA